MTIGHYFATSDKATKSLMFQVRTFLFYLVCILLAAPTSQAAIVEDLYQTKVDIKDQSQRTQQRAVRKALQKVLIKVSGNDELLDHPIIKDHVKRAADFLRSYRYEIEQGQIKYVAEFDQQSVEKMIRVAGFPIWDSRRPDTLIWLAIEDPRLLQREMLSETSNSPVSQLMFDTAQERGIAISLPLLDLTDIQQVSLFDVWGGFSQTIYAGSGRYGTDYVMSARIYFDDGSQQEAEQSVMPSEPMWKSDWQIMRNEQIIAGSVQLPNISDVSVALVNLLADQLANTYAISTEPGSGKGSVLISMDNVPNIKQYMQVKRLLESLSVVLKVTLIQQSKTTSMFELHLIGDVKDLTNALRLEDKVSFKKDEFGQNIEALEFNWNP